MPGPGVATVALVHHGVDVAGVGVAPPELVGERLVIGQVDDGRAVGLDPVAERDGGVVEILGRDPRPADLIGALGKLVVGDLSRKLA